MANFIVRRWAETGEPTEEKIEARELFLSEVIRFMDKYGRLILAFPVRDLIEVREVE